jgi:acyl-coenzyme A synthetase/AMP-(fatty) acid ligase
LPSMYVGACLCFSETPEVSDIVDVIVREKVTRLLVWPAQELGILEHAEHEGHDLSSIRRVLGPIRDEKGVVIPPERRIGGIMGMTETFGMHSIAKPMEATPPGKGGHWGRRLPGMERKIVDPETGVELPAGATGELLVRGRSLMQGYYKREREDVFAQDGFFATGDLASIDQDDYIYFHGRLTEMIKTSGANVSPKEVELALLRLQGVREAIVFGMPDPVKGEIVVAVVVPAGGRTLEAAALRERLRTEISPYKIPQKIIFMNFEDIPRTGSQKTRKGALLDMLISHRA